MISCEMPHLRRYVQAKYQLYALSEIFLILFRWLDNQFWKTMQNQTMLSGFPLPLFQDLVVSLKCALMSVQLLLQLLQLTTAW